MPMAPPKDNKTFMPPPPPSPSTKRPLPPNSPTSPAKKQSKWSADEDALIIDLRGRGLKWEDISTRLPGRSAISCRLHYQNYLERRSEWDEDRKTRLARLYERFKPEMWNKVASEMNPPIPWRAAEAMHWQLGEAEMARRAGVVPFSLTTVALEAPPRPRTSTQPTASANSRRLPVASPPAEESGSVAYPNYNLPPPMQPRPPAPQHAEDREDAKPRRTTSIPVSSLVTSAPHTPATTATSGASTATSSPRRTSPGITGSPRKSP